MTDFTIMKWISVEDYLPAMQGAYFCYDEETKSHRVAYFVDWSQLFSGDSVTHWQPLPPPP